MIIILKKNTPEKEIQKLIKKLEGLKLKPFLSKGVEATIICVVGDSRFKNIETLSALPFVEKAVPILKPYKLAGREVHKERSKIKIRDAVVGGKNLAIMAGPCSVENEKGFMLIAEKLQQLGVRFIRGGAYKPRTSPYAFQGLKVEGLKIMQKAARELDLITVTEVIDPEGVEIVGEYADILQIGARNMQNYSLLRRAGESKKPVLLKRGMAASLNELLMSAEYILSEGNPNVILCERGIKTFNDYTRNTLDLAIIPAIIEHSHLPIIIDPSHGTGVRKYVSSMSRAAIAAEADGLIIEVHTNPDEALSDGFQTLSLAEFSKLLKELTPIAESLGKKVLPSE
jgi:3-deoxy-7-phosphoheptulonate synthase